MNIENKEGMMLDNMNEYVCVIGVDHMTSSEELKLVKALEKGSEIQGVRFKPTLGDEKVLYTEGGNIKCSAFCEVNSHDDVCGDCISAGVLMLLKDLGIDRFVQVRFRAFDFSCRGEYHFENGEVTYSDFRKCFDNYKSISSFLEKKGLKMEDVFDSCFEVRNEDSAVFETMRKLDVIDKMFWAGNMEQNGYFMKIWPQSIADLRAFIAMACHSNGSFEEIMARLDEYYDLKLEDCGKNCKDLSESLKETHGLWLYETQTDDAKKQGLTPICGEPVLFLPVKIAAFSMYAFAYLCMKYGVDEVMKLD